MRRPPLRLAPAAILGAALALSLPAQYSAGRSADGGAILPHGWPITPAGPQIELSTLPMALTLAPGGRHVFALNAGFLPPSVSVVDLDTLAETQRLALSDGWLGLARNRAGDKVYVGGGARASVLELAWRDGRLSLGREFPAMPAERRRGRDFLGDVLLSADEGLLYAANVFSDRVVTFNARSGVVVGGFRTGARPYRMRLGLDPDTVWMSHWGGASVGLYSLSEGRRIETLPTGGLPSDLLVVPGEVEAALDEERDLAPVVARLFVASANTNSVWVYGLTGPRSARLIETIDLGPSPEAPSGTAPTALAVSPDGATLYVVCSGANFVAVVDISDARAQVVGAVPTGWYPTAAAAHPDGRLLYLNGKGGGSHPAPDGPDPARRGETSQYVAALQTGSLGVVPPLSLEVLAATTGRAADNLFYSDGFAADSGAPAGNPVPARPGAPSPIEHVVYVVKENRTYDQVLGDIAGAKGEPRLTVFGEDVAPNHRKLVREFVLFDNFYAAGDVSADGQHWTFGGSANDFVQKLWPARTGGRLRLDPFEGAEPAAVPAAGFLWSAAAAAGRSVRNYGVWAGNGPDGQPRVEDPALAAVTNFDYHGFDLAIPDGSRVDAFLADWKRLDEAGQLPRLSLVYLPNGHTAGRSSDFPTPRAMMAEHDWALGRLVEGVSRSRAWEKTLVLVVEDDAQDGADHVDSHRSICLVASPWARRGVRDSNFYSTASALRTVLAVLGLRPLTQFDASATPLWRSFTDRPDPQPYEAVRPRQPFDEANPSGAPARPRRASAGPKPSRPSL